MGKRPAPFIYANSFALTQSASDTVDFVNDSTKNDEAYEYFYPYSTAVLTFTGVTADGDTITLTSVPAFTIIPIAMRRINASLLTGTFLCLVPKGPTHT